ncbi:methyl-accepting chemotaxis protein [Bacillus changyiensis]|uniref:methyl-accepting chemotaxis protein n=1 Tax=Bacillus changyiensis TaxID=3004103 RepID=UPI0022E227C3|nr:methyl-accepting chemotaxis protein [Bacillus changyiensis]MDA1477823.1 methyl-accepting chemotaxis protein [Bacillus changyiensis]
MIVIVFITVLTGSIVGISAYQMAKKELVNSGKQDLKHLADTSTAVLNVLNAKVEKKEITLEEAKAEAREILNGPKLSGEQGYDFQKSKFLYKDKGYIVAYQSDYSTQVHPKNPIGQVPSSTENRKKMVAAAKASTAEDHFVSYPDQDDETGEAKDKMAYMTYFEPWDWSVGIAVFEDEFYKGLEYVKIFITVTVSVITLLSLVLFYFLIRKKVKLLSDVTAAALKISEGHLEETNLPESKDEVGLLGAAFNNMSSQLRGLMQGLQSTSIRLLDSASDLSAISEETSASSEEIGRAISEISAGTVTQASDLEGTNERLVSFTKSFDKMNTQSDFIEQMADDTETAAREGQNIVQKLKSSNEESLKASGQIRTGITSLNNKVQDISQITETIENISNETNLLALNASIEAARAGAHGSGFAVVASEVRKLAEQSKTAVSQIQNMINGIKQETENTVSLMSETMEHTSELDDAVKLTEQEFKKITVSIEKTMTEIRALNKELQNIKGQNDQITESVQSAAGVSQETAAAVEEITASVDEQVLAITNVAQAAEALTELSNHLNQEIEKYKL